MLIERKDARLPKAFGDVVWGESFFQSLANPMAQILFCRSSASVV
jgi:hypothetical protein